MIKAQLITIGTEITSGEVINSNAAWVSLRLEDLGVRVFSHLTVRDQHGEIFKALTASKDYALIVVTGGLGPTSDDITRECLADYTRQPLDFDEQVWTDLKKLYEQRELPLREAHRHQCHFPKNSERLPNPAGTALGFTLGFEGRTYFVLPGPPRELEGVWNQEVAPRLLKTLPPNPYKWVRWTCLGAPESEVAELVEKAIDGQNLEVGYRATIPYVKVKLYIDESLPPHRQAAAAVGAALAPVVVAEGTVDLAEEFLELWPGGELHVVDHVTEGHLTDRLLAAQKALRTRKIRVPLLNIQSLQCGAPVTSANLQVNLAGEGFTTVLSDAKQTLVNETKILPYRTSVSTERGKRSAAEWVIWSCVKTLRASARHSST